MFKSSLILPKTQSLQRASFPSRCRAPHYNSESIQKRAIIYFYVSNITRSINVVSNSDFEENLRSICRSYIAQANGVCSSKQNQAFHRTLQALGRNKELKICKYDKGNGVVVLDNDEYFKKLDKIVLDKVKFEEILVDSNKVHPIISNEDSIKDIYISM